MGLRVKDRTKPKLPPVAPGVYMAVCVGVIDLGEQLCEYKEKKGRLLQKSGPVCVGAGR